ncbi:hypothetical protein ABQE69_13415 [Mycolicibacillus trivialis]|nr:hypothetical protein [Mycolicibacillus trivialis]
MLLLAAGAAASAVCSTVEVAPVLDGEPVTTSVVYDPPQLLLTLLAVTAAGVLAVIGTARWWRSRTPTGDTP